jgi:hypothetical protein
MDQNPPFRVETPDGLFPAGHPATLAACTIDDMAARSFRIVLRNECDWPVMKNCRKYAAPHNRENWA